MKIDEEYTMKHVFCHFHNLLLFLTLARKNHHIKKLIYPLLAFDDVVPTD